eukprot:7729950-Heterocapsa_arctica.AAC.1
MDVFDLVLTILSLLTPTPWDLLTASFPGNRISAQVLALPRCPVSLANPPNRPLSLLAFLWDP